MGDKITSLNDLKNYISFSIKTGNDNKHYTIKNIIPNVSGETTFYTYTLSYYKKNKINDSFFAGLIEHIEKNYQLLTVDRDVMYFQRKPGTDGAGGGSRKSRRRVRKSRRSNAKKSRRRTRK